MSEGMVGAALWPERGTIHVETTASGYDQLVSWLIEHQVHRVGLEAQGCSTLSSWVGESEMPHADANRRRVAA